MSGVWGGLLVAWAPKRTQRQSPDVGRDAENAALAGCCHEPGLVDYRPPARRRLPRFMSKSVTISKLIVDPAIQIRESSHEPTIQRYMESFENLPPIDVFDTPKGMFVADGFQRVAAAMRLGLSTIEANVHKGSYEEAAEFAAVANTRSGDPLTAEERNAAIRRLRGLHPEWAHAKIAEVMSTSQRTVARVLRVDKVKGELLGRVDVSQLSERQVEVLSSADEELRVPLAQAAQKRGWSGEEVRDAIHVLRDERESSEYKQDLLAGVADPMPMDDSGERRVRKETVARQIHEEVQNDGLLALERALQVLGHLREFSAAEVIAPASKERLDQLARDLPDYIRLLESIRIAIQEPDRTPALEVVR